GVSVRTGVAGPWQARRVRRLLCQDRRRIRHRGAGSGAGRAGGRGPYPSGSVHRVLVDLACKSGIAVNEWRREWLDDPRIIETALEHYRLIHEQMSKG